jgi:hypothetical protein
MPISFLNKGTRTSPEIVAANVIMPTLAALFFALGVLRFAHGQAHTYTPWAGFLCLMVSGVLRAIEKFAAQADRAGRSMSSCPSAMI